MLKKFLFSLLCISFLCDFCFSAQELSLKKAVDLALANNPQILAARKIYESSQYTAGAALGLFLPRIDISGGMFKMYGSTFLDPKGLKDNMREISALSQELINGSITPEQYLSKLVSEIPSMEDKAVTDTISRAAATVIQPIFTGFKITAAAKTASLLEDAAKINLNNTQNIITASVIESYYRVLLAEDVLRIRINYRDDVKKHVSDAENLFNAGIISKSNKLRAEVALAEAQRDLHDSVSDKDLAFTLLSNDIGISIDEKETVLSAPMKMAQDIKSLDYYLSKADADNGVLKLLTIQKNILKQKYNVSVGALLPNVSLVGEYQILQDDLFFFEPEWSVGLTATMNIFSGGADYNRIKASKKDLEAVEEQIKSARNLINTGVRKLYNQCQKAKRDYEALSASLELARENLKLSNAAFKVGAGTSLEVLDAELSLKKIKTQQAEAIFDYNSAYADLLTLCNQTQVYFNQ
jgi:outer membrane protein TolC